MTRDIRVAKAYATVRAIEGNEDGGKAIAPSVCAFVAVSPVSKSRGASIPAIEPCTF
jgi:hypothetical protein